MGEIEVEISNRKGQFGTWFQLKWFDHNGSYAEDNTSDGSLAEKKQKLCILDIKMKTLASHA